MNRLLRILLAIVLLIALVAVRYFETSLFYDPLILFFKGAYKVNPLPSIHTGQLLAYVVLRFLLNTLLSLGLLWLLFLDKKIIQFAALLYAIMGMVLTVVFFILLHNFEVGNYQSLFYVRRFLIQPLFLLLLVPAFYFQKQTSQ